MAEQTSKLIVEQHLTGGDKLPSEFELAGIRGQMEPWVARLAAERAAGAMARHIEHNRVLLEEITANLP